MRVLFMAQIDLFKNHSYFVELCAKMQSSSRELSIPLADKCICEYTHKKNSAAYAEMITAQGQDIRLMKISLVSILAWSISRI